MIITVRDDLTCNVTTEDGLLECELPNYNPETLEPFSSAKQVEAFANTIEGNANYFVPKLSGEEKQAARDKASSEVNVSRAKQELVDTDWVENASVRDTNVTPHLTNAADFDAYRLALRGIVVSKPATVETWPTAPSAIWSE